MESDGDDSQLRALRVGTLVALLLLVSSPLQVLVLLLWPSHRYLLPQLVFRLGHKIIGIDCTVSGPRPTEGAALILSNHLSWLDIIILGANMPCHFIAKREVAGWPVFGQLAHLIGVMFLDRERRTATVPFRSEMKEALGKGRVLVLFPEGTSSEGSEVLKFKSALLPDMNTGSDSVHPVTLSFYGNRRHHSHYAWYDETPLITHMRAVFASGRVRARLQFGEPIAPGEIADRKELARLSHAIVSENLASAWKEAKEPVQIP